MNTLGTPHISGTDEKEDQLLLLAARLRANPGFDDAVRQYTFGLAKSRESQWLVNKLISQDARFRVVGYLLYLDADRERWPLGTSYGPLHELCTHRREVSARVLNTMLALLQFSGFVEIERDATDRRVKYYRPTARMQVFVKQWLDYAVRALDFMHPEGRRAQQLLENPNFARHFLISGGRDHILYTPPASRMPEFLQYFGTREGSSVVVLAVMQADMDKAPLPSRAFIAKLYGLSKSQIGNIIAEGMALGYLAECGLRPTDRLRADYRKWISIELGFYARHMPPSKAWS